MALSQRIDFGYFQHEIYWTSELQHCMKSNDMVSFSSLLFKFMSSPLWLFALFVLLSTAKAHAQKDFQFWATYSQQARLSKKWGYAFDLNYRSRGVFPLSSTLSAARMGINYHLNPNIRITAGYAWFGTYVTDRYQRWLAENRLYQQIQFNKKKAGLHYVNRIRLEQRFRKGFVNNINDETNVAFTFRARYLFQMQGPLKKKAGTEEVILSWQAADEIFFHWGENLNGNSFDQNRTLAGIVISPGRKIDIAVLYQFILQQQPVLQTTESIHSMRLILFHNLDFRKK